MKARWTAVAVLSVALAAQAVPARGDNAPDEQSREIREAKEEAGAEFDSGLVPLSPESRGRLLSDYLANHAKELADPESRDRGKSRGVVLKEKYFYHVSRKVHPGVEGLPNGEDPLSTLKFNPDMLPPVGVKSVANRKMLHDLDAYYLDKIERRRCLAYVRGRPSGNQPAPPPADVKALCAQQGLLPDEFVSVNAECVYSSPEENGRSAEHVPAITVLACSQKACMAGPEACSQEQINRARFRVVVNKAKGLWNLKSAASSSSSAPAPSGAGAAKSK